MIRLMVPIVHRRDWGPRVYESTKLVVVRDILERNAKEEPDEQFVSFEGGETWTRQQALEQAYAAAHVLRDAGIKRGDRVAVFLPNGPDFLRAWWGTAVLGATLVPINLAFRGEILDHLLRLSEPALAVVDPALEDQMRSSDLGAALRWLTPAALIGQDVSPPTIDEPIRPWDAHVLLLTSGTTGPSKLAEVSYQCSFIGGSWFTADWGATSRDVILIDLPMFHGAAIYQMCSAISMRVRLAVRKVPDLRNYWEVARETGATLAILLSSMVMYLLAQPPKPADREHKLRAVISSPLPPSIEEFQVRFGIPDIVTAYGSTEAPGSLVREPSTPLVPGYCGRVRPGFDVRLVDDRDIEVPVGEVGEAVVRAVQPWHLMTGYVNNPEAQARIMRNGWLHTGDLLRRDEAGNHFFVDRDKDALRRRGENISSFEVEAIVLTFPGISEAACVAARGGLNVVDDEVKVWVVPHAGVDLDLEALFLHCVDRMPHFMVPQFFEIADELPKTPTVKVQKFLLRERGNGPATWDRSEHGYQLTRNGLTRTAGSTPS